MVLTSDQIGTFAEYIAEMELTKPVDGRRRRALFRVVRLGDKHPIVDFLVEILGARGQVRGFFFVQVKGTTRGAPGASRVPVSVSPDDFNRLVSYPVPAYLVAVDLSRGSSYVTAAHIPRTAWISSITRTFPLRDETIRIALYREVIRFWRARRHKLRSTRFRDV